MIPKVIHYCWFGGKPLPAEVRRCIASWRKFAPDYEIREWNESNFDVHCHPFLESAYAAKAWAFVSDYARLKIVYDCGGIYLDTDVELRRNPDFLLSNPCFIGVQQVGHICTTGLGFGAVQGSFAVKRMLAQYDGLVYTAEKKELLACPNLNAAAVAELGYRDTENVWYGPELTVYPSRFFDPYSPGDSRYLMCEDTVSVHHYSATWMGGKTRWKRKLISWLGTERVSRLKQQLGKNKQEPLRR